MIIGQGWGNFTMKMLKFWANVNKDLSMFVTSSSRDIQLHNGYKLLKVITIKLIVFVNSFLNL